MPGHREVVPQPKNGLPLAGRGAEAVRDAIIGQLDGLPPLLRRSLTWDQGSELAQHAELKLATDIDVWFCDPHSPWQRGTNENTNGLLRQYFPRGTDLARHSRDDLDAVALSLNTRPRKTLDWQTPAEALDKLLTSTHKPVLRRPIESAQFTSLRYGERLAEIGAVPSIGSVGDSYDNALAEAVNALYKTELIRQQGPWKSVDDVELATLSWVTWFNTVRLHGTLDDIPPPSTRPPTTVTQRRPTSRLESNDLSLHRTQGASRRIANQAFFTGIEVYEIDTIEPQLGEPFDVLFDPAVQAEALHRQATQAASGEAPDRSSHVEGLNNEHWVGGEGLEPPTSSV